MYIYIYMYAVYTCVYSSVLLASGDGPVMDSPHPQDGEQYGLATSGSLACERELHYWQPTHGRGGPHPGMVGT